MKEESNDDVTLLDLALALAENLRLLLFVSLAAGLVGLGVAFILTPTYSAATRILPPQQQNASASLIANQLGALAGVAGIASGIKNPADTYVSMITSRTIADKLLARFKLRELYKQSYDQDARKTLASRTRVSAGRDGLIVIEVDDNDPMRAAALANAYVDELRELTQKLAVTEAAQRRLFFENQLKQAKDELAKAEIALGRSGISAAALKAMPQSALETVARLKAQVTAQEVRLGAMRGYMTESNPEYRQTQQELTALRTELAKAEVKQPSNTKGDGAEYIATFREFKYYETLYDLMAKQYEMARLDEAREGAVIQVIDAAVPPERKSRPRRALIAVLSALGGFFLFAVFLLVRHGFRTASADPAYSKKLERLRRLVALKS